MVVNSSVVSQQQQQVPLANSTTDDESTTISSAAESSAPSSPSIRQSTQHRSAPCRLFIASPDQLHQQNCVICGFRELDHHSRVVQRAPPQNSNGSVQNVQKYCCSDMNILENGGPSTPNSYDVRGEYLSKEDFRAKYGNFLKSSVYYYTDRSKNQRPFVDSGGDRCRSQGPISDSGGETDNEQRSKGSANYWSDTESTLITFRPKSALTLTLTNPMTKMPEPETEVLKLPQPEKEASKMPQQHTQVQKAPEIPPRRSAFIDYKATFNTKAPTPVNGSTKKRPSPNGGVSFHVEPDIIGEDGGVEHFFDNSDSSDGGSTIVGDENGHDTGEDEEDLSWAMEPKTEFERITEFNTEFNSNRKNFIDEKKEAAVLVSVTIRPPPAPVAKSVAVIRQNRAVVEAGVNEPAQSADHYLESSSEQEDSKPVYAPIRKPAKTEYEQSVQPVMRKSRLNSELDEKLQRMARDLDACRLGPPKVKPPAPPPPAVPQPTSATRSGFIKKSYSAFVVPTPSPILNISSTDLMTSSVGGPRVKSMVADLDMILNRSVSHERCSSVDISSPNISDESHSAVIAKAPGPRQSRSRFASIRKFLRISTEPTSGGSVRRSHLDSSSTNCSTISCSSSSNGSISFGNHLHSSLRKFPLFGGKHRADLNAVRGLFHGANECCAVDEIAQDTDVIVTEITELPSTNNTLVRASKRACHFGPPSPVGQEKATRTQGIITNGHEYSYLNGTKHPPKHDSQSSNFDGSFMYVQRLEVNGHDSVVAAPSTAAVAAASPANSTSLPPRPPSFNPVSSTTTKVKRVAPAIPAVNGECEHKEKLNEPAPIPVKELAEKATETIWQLASTVGVQTTPIAEFQPKPMPPVILSQSTTRASTPASTTASTTESVKRTISDDRYDQLVAGHLSALSHLVEHFPSTTRQCRRKLQNLGVDPTKLKWSDFNVVANSPLLVTETSALYAGILKLDNKPESQSLKVDLMITPLRYNNPLPTTMHQHRSFFPPIVAEFQEYIPSRLIKLTQHEEEDGDSEPESNSSQDRKQQSASTLCRILVLPRMMVSNLESYADHTSSRHRPQKQPCLHEREVCFIMIQFMAALKYLQSKGVEEIQADLDGFLLMRTTTSKYPQLVLCSESFSTDCGIRNEKANQQHLRITLCQGALAALCQLLHTEIPTEELIRDQQPPNFIRMTPYSDGFQKAAEILHSEKPHSLTTAKSIFEYMFWVDQERQNRQENMFENEQQAKWWLDRERARFVCSALKSLLYFPVDGITENSNSNSSGNSSVCKLDIVDEYKAQFLLHATAKSLMDAQVALENAANSGEILL